MQVLVIDVGGTNVKLLASGETDARKFPSGPTMTVEQLVAHVTETAADWKYDAISIGYPGPVVQGRPRRRAAQFGAGLGRL